MNAIDTKKKMKGIVRFTGGGALLLAIIGLISISPLSASGQDARHRHGDHEAAEVGGHYFGAVHAGPHRLGNDPEGHIEFLKIFLDLSERQADEIEPILAEQREKMAEFRETAGMHGRRGMRMKHMRRRGDCDKVDRVERRADMRRQRREFEETREKMHSRIERQHKETEVKLAKILDDDQMEKLLKLHELRTERREERQARRCR